MKRPIQKLAFLALGLALVAVCGCDSRTRRVVVSVNGENLTVGQIEDRVTSACLLRRHRLGANFGKRQEARFVSVFTNKYPRQFVRERLLAGYARREGIEVSASALEKGRKAVFRAYGVSQDGDLKGLLKATGVKSALVEEQVRNELLPNLIRRHLVSKFPTNFPPKHAETLIARMHDYNARMTLTNALVFARATNVWHFLQKGSNFVATADAFTEIPEDRGGNCAWGAFAKGELQKDYPEVLAHISCLKSGDFTEPFETDNGLAILRFDGLDKENRYQISRIFFLLPEFIEIGTPEEVLNDAKREYADDLFKNLLKQLYREATIAYPGRKAEKKGKTK